MGVKKLLEAIIKLAPSAVQQVPLRLLRGRVVAVDVSTFMYKYAYGTRSVVRDTDIIDKCPDEVVATAITQLHKDMGWSTYAGFKSMLNALARANIKVIFVWDGAPPEEKRETLQNRTVALEKQLARLQVTHTEENDTGGTVEQRLATIGFVATSYGYSFAGGTICTAMLRNQDRIAELHGVQFEHRTWAFVRELLDQDNVLSVTAPGEAEAFCAAMTRLPKSHPYKVDAVITEDGDVLAFGALIMWRNFKAQDPSATIISLDEVVYCLGMTRESFIDACAIAGNDYNPTGFSMSKAVKYIKKYKSIERLVEASLTAAPSTSTTNLPDRPHDNAFVARRMFTGAHDAAESFECDAQHEESNLLCLDEHLFDKQKRVESAAAENIAQRIDAFNENLEDAIEFSNQALNYLKKSPLKIVDTGTSFRLQRTAGWGTGPMNTAYTRHNMEVVFETFMQEVDAICATNLHHCWPYVARDYPPVEEMFEEFQKKLGPLGSTISMTENCFKFKYGKKSIIRTIGSKRPEYVFISFRAGVEHEL